MEKLIIFGYIFSAICYITYYIGRFFKKKSSIMISSTITQFFAMLSYFCFGSNVAAINASLAMLRCPCIIYKEKKNKDMHWLFAIFAILMFGGIYFCWEGYRSLITTASAFSVLTSEWYFKNPQYIRIVSIFATLFDVIFMFIIGNYLGFVCELLVILSNLFSFLKYRKQK